MIKKSAKNIKPKVDLHELTGKAYNYLRKFAGLKWRDLSNIEHLQPDHVGRRKNLARVKPHHVVFLYNAITIKYQTDQLFWRGLTEYNKYLENMC